MINVKDCVALGNGLIGKLTMVVFALLAPSGNKVPRLWRRVVRRVTPDVWLRPAALNGLRLSINPREWSQTVIFEEVFLRNGYDLKKVKFAPEKIIDCGAHIGLFSLLAKSVFPSVPLTAYEPNPSNLEYARRQFVKNQLDVEVVAAAVSNKPGLIRFSSSNSHSGRLNHDSSTIWGIEVEVIDLPKYIESLHLSSLLLKMDVEGEELRILPDLVPILPNKSAVFFELHSGEDGWERISRLFADHGFHTEKINSRGLFIDGFACRGPQRREDHDHG